MKTLLALPLLLALSASAQELASSAEEIRPLLVGSAAPEAALRTVDGKEVTLAQAAGGRPAVVIFYRGGWCPYCNTHLGELKTVEAKLAKLGYVTLALSPDKPEELAKSVKKNKLSYTLLSDSQLAAAKAFGIAFQVDGGTLKKYLGYGINLRAASGEEHDGLPVPSVFLIGKDGKVKFVHADPDYKVRLKPAVLLAAAQAAL